MSNFGGFFSQYASMRHWTFCQYFMLIVKFKSPQGGPQHPLENCIFCVLKTNRVKRKTVGVTIFGPYSMITLLVTILDHMYDNVSRHTYI